MPFVRKTNANTGSQQRQPTNQQATQSVLCKVDRPSMFRWVVPQGSTLLHPTIFETTMVVKPVGNNSNESNTNEEIAKFVLYLSKQNNNNEQTMVPPKQWEVWTKTLGLPGPVPHTDDNKHIQLLVHALLYNVNVVKALWSNEGEEIIDEFISYAVNKYEEDQQELSNAFSQLLESDYLQVFVNPEHESYLIDSNGKLKHTLMFQTVVFRENGVLYCDSGSAICVRVAGLPWPISNVWPLFYQWVSKQLSAGTPSAGTDTDKTDQLVPNNTPIKQILESDYDISLDELGMNINHNTQYLYETVTSSVEGKRCMVQQRVRPVNDRVFTDNIMFFITQNKKPKKWSKPSQTKPNQGKTWKSVTTRGTNKSQPTTNQGQQNKGKFTHWRSTKNS